MKNSFLVPTEDKKFAKDLRSNAFLNIDEAGYKTFLQERNRIMRQQQLEKQVAAMQQDMDEIKNLLRKLINGKTNGETNI